VPLYAPINAPMAQDFPKEMKEIDPASLNETSNKIFADCRRKMKVSAFIKYDLAYLLGVCRT